MVAGKDTRRFRPADLAGDVATLFQDPEDQVVFGRVENEVAFGLENVGTPPGQIWPRVHEALAEAGAARLAERRTETLSAGELQRVCLASVLALEPTLLLLDEPTSQLDPEGAEQILDLACELGAAVLVSEQRPTLPLERCDRVLFVADGRIEIDATRDEGLDRLPAEYLPREPRSLPVSPGDGDVLCRLDEVSFAYDSQPVVERALADAAARGGRRADRPERRREDDSREDRRGAARAAVGKRRDARPLLLPLAGSGAVPRQGAGRGRGGPRRRRRPRPGAPRTGRGRARRLRRPASTRRVERRT